MALGIGEPTTSERCELSTGVAGLVAFAAAVIPHVLRLHRGKRTKRALVTVQHAADHVGVENVFTSGLEPGGSSAARVRTVRARTVRARTARRAYALQIFAARLQDRDRSRAYAGPR